MYIKPYILAMTLANTSLGFSSCANHEKPRIQSPIKKSGEFKWEDESLKDVLDELAARYRAKICNPQDATGVAISGVISQGKSIDEMCEIVNRVEAGHAYVLHLDGTIYVSKDPFSKNFVRDKGDWPCK